jgi:hypothetical protein
VTFKAQNIENQDRKGILIANFTSDTAFTAKEEVSMHTNDDIEVEATTGFDTPSKKLANKVIPMGAIEST